MSVMDSFYLPQPFGSTLVQSSVLDCLAVFGCTWLSAICRSSLGSPHSFGVYFYCLRLLDLSLWNQSLDLDLGSKIPDSASGADNSGLLREQ